MKITLNEALLQRKFLNEKIQAIKYLKENDVFYKELFQRIPVNETVNDINVIMPKLHLCQVTEEYDFYAKNLRLIDAFIQKTNHSTELDVDSHLMQTFSEYKRASESKTLAA